MAISDTPNFIVDPVDPLTGPQPKIMAGGLPKGTPMERKLNDKLDHATSLALDLIISAFNGHSDLRERAAHREVRRGYGAAYHAAHREADRERSAAYHATHREVVRERDAAYRKPARLQPGAPAGPRGSEGRERNALPVS